MFFQVRTLAKWVFFGTEKQKSFRSKQEEMIDNKTLALKKPLKLVRDVRHRWSFLIYCLLRFMKLWPAIQEWIATYKVLVEQKYGFPAKGHEYLCYLLDISKGFAWLTNMFRAFRNNHISDMMSGYRTILKHFRKCLKHVEEECKKYASQELPENPKEMANLKTPLLREDSTVRPPYWLRLIRKGVTLAIAKVLKYIKKLWNENRELIYLFILLNLFITAIYIIFRDYFNNF